MHDHLAPLGELDSVAHQVDEDLPQAAGISNQRIETVRFDFKGKFEAFLMGAKAKRFHRVAQAVCQAGN